MSNTNPTAPRPPVAKRASTFVQYDGLPEPVRNALLELETFIGGVDGKDTVIQTDGDTCIDDGTIDAEDAVKAFNTVVAALSPPVAEPTDDGLVKLLQNAEGCEWITGRDPGDTTICIRITESDRKRLLAAITRPIAEPTQGEIEALQTVEKCLSLRVRARVPPYSDAQLLEIIRAALTRRPAPAAETGECEIPTIRVEDVSSITKALLWRSDKFRTCFNMAELEGHVAFAMAPHYATPSPDAAPPSVQEGWQWIETAPHDRNIPCAVPGGCIRMAHWFESWTYDSRHPDAKNCWVMDGGYVFEPAMWFDLKPPPMLSAAPQPDKE